MDLKASLLRNKSQNFAVNIFEITTFLAKYIFDEMSCIALQHHSQKLQKINRFQGFPSRQDPNLYSCIL